MDFATAMHQLKNLSINEHSVELLENKGMADVVFEVDGVLFTAHRSVLSARSPVFKAEFFGGRTESKVERIQIKDIKPAIFKAMLDFIYSDSVPDIISNEDIPMVTQVQHLYKAAARYALDGLKIICEDRLIRDVSINSVISSLALADEHNCCGLKHACLDYACKPENLSQLAVKAEYIEFMVANPYLLKELSDNATDKGYNEIPSRSMRNDGYYLWSF
ncbi:BTB/POZ domain containing protein [Rhynchospora pubera]|uniref:BTB/POZ domain containing protein n=1 Tax=Rhynchospora pubera TaxID=906938 RepID=A0AAV8G1P4_9POAL|nr:BTB/POZ domain containing protein [Rhynchospora pubera]